MHLSRPARMQAAVTEKGFQRRVDLIQDTGWIYKGFSSSSVMTYLYYTDSRIWTQTAIDPNLTPLLVLY